MTEFEIHKELFPFKCDNPDCSEEYDIEKFYNAALFWGYICLTSGDYNLIGLTCPECLHTTVNKYKLDGNFLTVEDFNKFGLFRDPHGDIHLLKNQVIVPFSKHIIKEAGIDLKISASQPGESELIYHVPKVIKINGFSFVLHPDYDPKSLNVNLPPYSWTATEREILVLCEFENSKKLKVVPRISHERGLYSRTDAWSQYSSFESFFGNSSEWDDSDSKTREFINDSIDLVLCVYAAPGSFAGKSKPSNLSTAEYNNLNFDLGTLAWGKPESKVNFEEFFRDYKRARNKLDFEMIFRTEFLDEHVRRIYYEPDWQERIGLDPSFENFDALPPDRYLGSEENPPPVNSEKQVLPPTDTKKSQPSVKKTVISTPIQPQIMSLSGRGSETAIKEMQELQEGFNELKKIISENSQMIKLKKEIATKYIKAPKLNFLLTGETSVGKELFAAALHETSGRRGEYVKVNCAAIPKDTIASELFGHVKGAFTGADTKKEGLFAVANGGTILLDEIGDIPMDQQPHLLRVIRENEIRPVGGTKTEKIDVKMIFATNRDLKKEVDRDTFREDLFYRISGCTITIPPLRKRKDDIPLLVRYFVKNSEILKDKDPIKNPPDINEQVFSTLAQHDWPGNIQELKDDVEQIVLEWDDSGKEKIGPEHIPKDFLKKLGSQVSKIKEENPFEKGSRFLEAIERNKGNVSAAARELKISEKTIYRGLAIFPHDEWKAKLAAYRTSQKKK